MKDWLKSPEPEAMMGPKPKGGIEDIDEDLFEGLPPPEEPVGPDDGMQTVQLPSLKETCRRGTPIILACLGGFSLLTLPLMLLFIFLVFSTVSECFWYVRCFYALEVDIELTFDGMNSH